MGLIYFKRYRMEIDLVGREFSAHVPPEYQFVPWAEELLETHAEVKYLSFKDEIDAQVFPCFTERGSCLRLMEEISRKSGFLPEATWLVRCVTAGRSEYCGTIQGIQDLAGFGAVQNIGVTPAHRGRGLGTLLLKKALIGFQQYGLRKSYLEVTAQNQSAVDLYLRFGFSRVRTLYKAAEAAYT